MGRNGGWEGQEKFGVGVGFALGFSFFFIDVLMVGNREFHYSIPLGVSFYVLWTYFLVLLL